MKNYRLKPEATKFFKDNLATCIFPWDTWNSLNVDDKALEEVEDAFISYGHVHENKDYTASSLGGWSEKEGQKFHFTINFPSVKFREFDEFGKGKIVRELMDKIQYEINYFYREFINTKNESN